MRRGDTIPPPHPTPPPFSLQSYQNKKLTCSVSRIFKEKDFHKRGIRCLGERLVEANQEQQFNRSVEDLEMWLGETEAQVQSEDLGKVWLTESKLSNQNDIEISHFLT